MPLNFPNSPNNGDTYEGYTYNSTKGAWAPAAADTSSVTVYATVDDLPSTGTTGDQAFVTATNRLYIWNGTGWYNIALINTTPSISGADSSYVLATDGTPTVVTITASDPEGLPITYDIVSDTSGNTATVTSNNNIFTVTPSTNDADAGTFSLTFRASDGVNIAQAVSEFTLQFKVVNSHYTTALITSVGGNNADNNDFVDSSINSHTITAVGNATQTTFSPYRHGGYSTYFDGSGDYLISDTNFTAIGTDDFTIEFWYNGGAQPARYPCIIGTLDAFGATGAFRVMTHNDNSNLFMFAFELTGYTFNTENYNDGVWRHFAVTREGTSLRGFVNGVQQGSTLTMGSNITSRKILVGGNLRDNEHQEGYISDVRVINGTALYTSNFTPPTERLTAITNTSLLTCHLPYIADGSTNSYAITVNGNAHTEPFAPYDYETYSATNNGGSMYFDGTGDYLLSTGESLDTGDFAVEAWLYPTAVGSSDKCWFESRDSNSSGNGMVLFINTSGQLSCYSSGALRLTSSKALKPNTWYHVAFVRNNGTIYWFIDGSSSGSATYSSTIAAPGGFKIGARNDTAANFIGYISDLRVVKGAAVYTSAFTPPTAPLTAISNTSLLLSGTNAGIIDKSQSVKALTLAGDTKSSTTQTKYLTSSMYFDGMGDAIKADWYATGLGGFSGNFTVEAWVCPTAVGAANNPAIFTQAVDITQYSPLIIQQQSGSYNYILSSSSTGSSWNLANASTIGSGSANTWGHIAVVRDGTNIKAYFDGTLVTTIAVGTTALMNATSTYFWIGGANYTNTYFNGYISDLRITKGLARYTSNFTPPAAALQG